MEKLKNCPTCDAAAYSYSQWKETTFLQAYYLKSQLLQKLPIFLENPA